MLKNKPSVIPWQAVMLVALTALLTSCAVKHLAPAPVVGIDIAQVSQGQIAPFNGTLFSPYYLNEYLQWKATQ